RPRREQQRRPLRRSVREDAGRMEIQIAHIHFAERRADGSRSVMKTFFSGLLIALVATAAHAQVNAGEQKPEATLPFTMTQVAEFKLGWRMAFLPDGRVLITEKVGPVWLMTQQGEKTPVDNVPAVLWQGQGGMLGVYLSPKYA